MKHFEKPFRQIIIEYHPHEAANERDVAFYGLACKLPQVIFPDCKGARRAGNRFYGDENDGKQVGCPETHVTDKGPLETPSHKDCDLTTHGEEHINQVKYNDNVCKQGRGTMNGLHVDLRRQS